MQATDYFIGSDGVRIAADVQGAGPFVLFVHGFPELRQSWGRLAPAVAATGFRTCAVDVRGYGDSEAPPKVADYRMQAIVGDLVAVADALSPDLPVVLVGHDWGAAIVWHTIMARPDRFRAVAALSVPWGGHGDEPFEAVFTRRFTARNRFFYQAYFQQPGVAEAELEADPARFLKAFYHSISGDAEPGDWPLDKTADATLLEGIRFPDRVPPWLEDGYFEQAVRQFSRTGFFGPVSRYRNSAADFRWASAFHPVIRRPALFIGGSKDPAFVLGAKEPIARMQALVPALEHHVLDGCGHWTQAERAAEVEALLLPWLGRLSA